MKTISHPLLKPDTLQQRAYQETIAKEATNKNMLVVLPTGLGKTPISVLVAADRLETFPNGKILMLAPTRPLAAQSFASFKKFFDLPEKKFCLVTGTVAPQNREGFYKTRQLIFATPQTIENDLKNKLITLENVVLIIFDEAHHSIGNYAYPFVAKAYLDQAQHPRILGLTASPGSTKEKINEIRKTLHIETVEIRTEKDEDVAPYVHEKDITWIHVTLPERFEKIKSYLVEAYNKRLTQLKGLGYTKPLRMIGKKDLLELQTAFQKRIRNNQQAAFYGVRLTSEAIKIEHALALIETQGAHILQVYFKKLHSDTSKAAQVLLKDRNVQHAIMLTDDLVRSGARHPKIAKLLGLISMELEQETDPRIIVFANYRTTVKEIVNALQSVPNARPVEFVGQKEGLSQKEQLKRLQDFSDGVYNILVGTSISEEGLDIAEADLAIFYEPVASPLRAIQRRGRVGRASVGTVIVLITKKTRDEGFYWSSVKKEANMKKTLYDIQAGQRDMNDYET